MLPVVILSLLLLHGVVDAGYPGFITYDELQGQPYQVTWNNRSLVINGKPSIFLSGSIHPPRMSPGMWADVMTKAKQDGLNMIEVYTFWNYHEHKEGEFDWTGRGNLTQFLTLAAEIGLFVNLRIGPYVCAEWNYGGIPVWVGQKSDMQFRCYNEAWMAAMQRWMEVLVEQVRPFFAPNGGPIMVAQVENELHVGSAPKGAQYIDWCGQVAAQLNVGVPWIMCNGDSAANTINTCNGNDCAYFIEMHGQSGRILIDQPAMWTENEGWFQNWGTPDNYETNGTSSFSSFLSHSSSRFAPVFTPEPASRPHNVATPTGNILSMRVSESSPGWVGFVPSRTPYNLAYTVARWFARGGSHHNYYMYMGGNHYGRWAGSGIANFYADDVNFRADTLPNEPKRTHLHNLQQWLALMADVLLGNPAQAFNGVPLLWFNPQTGRWENGTQQVAFEYPDPTGGIRNVTFIESSADVVVLTLYNGRNYTMNPYSVQIVNASGGLLFDTSMVPPAGLERQTVPIAGPFAWRVWSEPFPAISVLPSATATSPLEQLSVTADDTEYLWYQTTVPALSNVSGMATMNLNIDSVLANAFVAFIDGVKVGQVDNHDHAEGTITFSFQIQLDPSIPHQLYLLSESLGIDNGMDACSGAKSKGVVGSVKIGSFDLTNGNWTMRPGLAGEVLQVYTAAGSASVPWSTNWKAAATAPVTWFQTEFPSPQLDVGVTVCVMNASGMGRGHFYVNGHDLGRYWMILVDGTNEPTQVLYHIPHDWLTPDGGMNLLTLGEVIGASDPSQVNISITQMVPVV